VRFRSSMTNHGQGTTRRRFEGSAQAPDHPYLPDQLGSNWNLITASSSRSSACAHKDFGDCIASPTQIVSCPGLPGILQDPTIVPVASATWSTWGGRAQGIHQDRIDGRSVSLGRRGHLDVPDGLRGCAGSGKYNLGQPGWSVTWAGMVGGNLSATLVVRRRGWQSSNVNLTNIQYFIFYAPPGGIPTRPGASA